MNPTSLKQPVNGLAELVVSIRWCEWHIAQRDDIGDHMHKQHFDDTCYDHLRERRSLLSTIHHNMS
tara:strand:+ start:453 stop:650 length:198 start_codon:yes stop_codon:yes gene_type:complete